jgi:hypothetical protein
MNYFYTFNSKLVDGQSIIHLINTLPGDSLVGAEIGVGTAQNFCTYLQNCPRISKMYGVDSYQPYFDYLKIEYDGEPAYFVDEKQIDFIKVTAMHNIKFSGHADKVIFFNEDTNSAVNKIINNELDFIFIDTYLTNDQVRSDLIQWYPKVKKGGVFAGHDWSSDAVRHSVFNFMKNNNIQSHLSVFDNTWVFIK